MRHLAQQPRSARQRWSLSDDRRSLCAWNRVASIGAIRTLSENNGLTAAGKPLEHAGGTAVPASTPQVRERSAAVASRTTRCWRHHCACAIVVAPPGITRPRASRHHAHGPWAQPCPPKQRGGRITRACRARTIDAPVAMVASFQVSCTRFERA